MRQTLRGVLAAAVTGGLACAVIGPAACAPEHSLLGVRLWDSTWKQVLAKHGQPTRIVVGTPAAPQASPGMGSPGMGMSGMGMPGGMGMPMASGASGMSGLPGLSGMGPGRAPMAMGSSGMGSMSYYGQMMRMRGGASAPGAEGEAGPPPGFGMSSSPMGMGGAVPGGAGMSGAQTQQSAEEEVTWIYEHGLNTEYYLFNRDGRLVQIQSFGYGNGGVTSRGAHLGDSTAAIYHGYGWPEELQKDDARGTMLLNYAKKSNVAFQLLDRHDGKGYRVVGITVGITRRSQIPGNAGASDDE